MADQRVNGNLILIGTSGGTIALGSQPSGGGFTILLPTNIPQIGQTLVVNSVFNGNTATAQWSFPTTGVTSVTLTTPSVFTVTGSPILAAPAWSNSTSYLTSQVVNFSSVSYVALSDNMNQQPNTSPAYWAITTSGTINLGLASQTPNTIWAGPASGLAAAPTFRTMVVADLFGGTGASNTTFLRGDGTWATPADIDDFVVSFNGRTGVVVAQSGDYSYDQISNLPQLPQNPAVPSHNWLNNYSASTGMFSYSQPSVSDLSNGTTGSGNIVLATSPTISGATLSGAVTISGTASFTTANPTFFSVTGSGAIVLATSPTITGATLAGTTTATNVHIMGTLADGTNSVGTSGQALTSTVTGVQWANVGTITGVGLLMPIEFNVFGSPITSGSSNISVALATQSANMVWAGPTTGAVAVPTFRALVSDDIPTLNNHSLTGTTTLDGVVWPATPPTTGQVLTAISASATNWQTPSSGTITGVIGNNQIAIGTGTSTITSTPNFTWASGVFNAISAGYTVTDTSSGGLVLTEAGSGGISIDGGSAGIVAVSNLTLESTLTDGSASVGTSGQLLSSTLTGTAWLSQSSLSIATSQLTGTIATAQLTTVEGTGSKVQLTNSGVTVSGDVVTYDAAGNVQDSGTLLSSLAPKASPTFTGTVTLPAVTLSGAMTVGSVGASIDFSGGGTINASELYGVTISATPPTTSYVLTATSATTADWEPAPGGGGSTTLAGLTDVMISSPANNDVLTYNSGASKWENMAGGGGGGTIGGTIAAHQIAFGTASNTIGGDSANFTWNDSTTALVVNSAGGALFTDSGSAGISLDSTAGFGGGIQLTSAGAGINWFTSSASGGSYITDQGSTGIFLLTETSSGGGIDLQTRGTDGFITLDSQGNGGTTIQDEGTTGIFLWASNAAGSIFVENQGSGGSFWEDTGGGGINFDCTGTNTFFEVDVSGTSSKVLFNHSTGNGGTEFEDGGGGPIKLIANTGTSYMQIINGTSGGGAGGAGIEIQDYGAGGVTIDAAQTSAAFIHLNPSSSNAGIKVGTGGVAGATAGPFSAITSIQTIQGIVTTLADVSDERLKTVTAPFERGLNAVVALNPKLYTWNEAGQKSTGFSAEQVFAGFTAQDVQKAIPEAVGLSKAVEGDYLSLDTRPILAAMVNAIKELAAENKSLKDRIMKLENN